MIVDLKVPIVRGDKYIYDIAVAVVVTVAIPVPNRCSLQQGVSPWPPKC